MKFASFALSIVLRWRSLLSAGLFACSLAFLWAGFGLSEILPSPRVAVAESVPENHRQTPPGVRPRRAELLQSFVDSLALGLGGALDALADEAARRAALGRALNSLTFALDGEAYFTAWQGTRVVHSPLTPDAADLDFADALDGRGSPFVQLMEDVAGSGGGFIRASLPPRAPRPVFGGVAVGGDAVSAAIAVPSQKAGASGSSDGLSAGIVEQALAEARAARGLPLLPEAALRCADRAARYGLAGRTAAFPEDPDAAPLPGCRRAPGRSSLEAAPVEQIVYIRRIPQSPWHIAAFLPATPLPAVTAAGFSSVWSGAAVAPGADSDAEEDFRNGLRVSGFSLAGLAGLLVLPGMNGAGLPARAARQRQRKR
jgi:hypothetical protein